MVRSIAGCACLAPALLTFGCGGAAPRTAAPAAASASRAAPSKPIDHADRDLGFHVQFFRQPTVGDPKTEKLPFGTVTGYALTAGDAKRAQLMTVEAVKFNGDGDRASLRCQEKLGNMFIGFARDRLACPSAHDPELVEHAASVYSITANVSDCGDEHNLSGRARVVCDERDAARTIVFSIAAFGAEGTEASQDAFLASLELRGGVRMHR